MIFIALGANLPSRFGDPPETLAAAREALQERGIEIIKASRLWLTAPVPVSDQPWFHNQVIAVSTGKLPDGLLADLHIIEKKFGRIRSVRNEARVLDLDIIAWHDQIIEGADLTIPHPRMQERLFVLGPLADIAPDWIHPATGRTARELLEALPGDQKAEVVNG